MIRAFATGLPSMSTTWTEIDPGRRVTNSRSMDWPESSWISSSTLPPAASVTASVYVPAARPSAENRPLPSVELHESVRPPDEALPLMRITTLALESGCLDPSSITVPEIDAPLTSRISRGPAPEPLTTFVGTDAAGTRPSLVVADTM